jgi:hypothetical protein
VALVPGIVNPRSVAYNGTEPEPPENQGELRDRF